MRRAWSASDIKKVRELAAQNMSLRAVAREFGVSRNAISGIALRSDITFHADGYTRQKGGERSKPIAPKPVPVAAEEPPAIGPINEFSEERTCRWIHGDVTGGHWQCCGAQGHPWCDFHRGKVFNRQATLAARGPHSWSAKRRAA